MKYFSEGSEATVADKLEVIEILTELFVDNIPEEDDEDEEKKEDDQNEDGQDDSKIPDSMRSHI